MSAAPLLVVNGRLWDGVPLAHDALCAIDGRIVALGTTAALRERYGPARDAVVIDAAGSSVTPGLCDAHIHLLAWARAQGEVALLGSKSRAEALARVAAFMAEGRGTGAIVGRGWEASTWREPPERGALDALVADRPVLLHSKDFHTLWVNSAALRAARVSRHTPDPEGGRIERDAAGEPTGILRENAVRSFERLQADAERSAGSEDAQLAAAARELHAWGITMVHDFERGAATLHAMRRFATGTGPRVRVLQSLGLPELERALEMGLESGIGDDWFRIGHIKLFADGTLGSRTAAMLEPYEGTTDLGLETLTPAEVGDIVGRAARGGLAVAIHAIGDRACRTALDAFAAAGDALRVPSLPPRIEHAQLVAEEDLSRFAALGVAASMQPVHCVSDAAQARLGWGKRCERSYAWRALKDRGALLAFGSDAPVESPAPGAALEAALTRRDEHGEPFFPWQCIDLDAALAAYTRGPAVLAGAAGRLGTLAPGAAADLVVWDRDLHRTPPDRLHEAGASCTVVGGQVVHGASHAAAPARR